jgi:predicted AAA+ superfamily ATPase
VLKQTIVRLIQAGVDPRRICFFAADELSTFTDLITFFQTARQLIPDLADAPRYFLIDEITAIPNWQQGAKWVRDNTAVADDCIVVTGSSAGDIAAGTTHLAGRRGPDVGLDRLLLPMSFPEFVRCAGFGLDPPPPLPLQAFYTDEGRAACREAIFSIDILADAFEHYLLIGGYPQAVTEFRRTAQVSDGFARDLWDVAQADLRALGVSRPELAIRLLERIIVGMTSPLSMRSLAESLEVTHVTISSWLNALADAYTVLFLFQEHAGLPDLRKQRKLYPLDPFLAQLPSRLSMGAYEPDQTRLAEAALAAAIFRSVEGDVVDRFGQPGRVYFYRSGKGAEVDFVVPAGPYAAEAKYIDRASVGEARAMVANFGGGLLLTRSAIDIQPGVTILPAAIFAWLIEERA